MNVSDDARPAEQYSGAYFSANVFKLFGVRPIIGRDFLPEDDQRGADPVVMLGERIWKSRYGADPSIVGRAIRINDVPATVVGVMPETMDFPGADVWMPLSRVPGLAARKRDERFGTQVLGRLAPGVSRQQAQSELTTIAARLEHDFPATNKNISATVMTFKERLYGGPIRLVLLASMGAVGFVLLIACVNVANLLLVRSTKRAREIAIRISIGATRWRIVRQLLAESVLLAALGGGLGLLLAFAGTRWFDAATQGLGRPTYLQFTMDGRVLAFFATVCLATGILFGLAPALHTSKTDINEVIKEGGRGGSGGLRAPRWTSALVIGELTLTLVLLASAGFMIRSFLALYRLNLGIETAHLLTMNLSLPDRKYPTDERRASFYQRLDERLGGMGAIRGGTIASSVPFGGGPTLRLTIDGRGAPPGERPSQVTRVAVGSRYLDTLGLTLMRGRAFASTDGTVGHEVGIVNQRLVSMYFASDDPLGRRIQLVPDPPTGVEPPWITIIGVSPTIRQRHLREPDPDPVVYVPYRLAPGPSMVLMVQHAGRAIGYDQHPARGSARSRSGPAALWNCDHGSDSRTEAMVRPRVRHDVRGLRDGRADAVGGGSLRDDGVHGHAAHARDRHSDGARRRGSAGLVAVRRSIVWAARHRPHAGNGGRVRRRPSAAEPAGADERERSAYVDCDRDGIRNRLARRVLCAGAAGHRGRSDERTALRMSHAAGRPHVVASHVSTSEASAITCRLSRERSASSRGALQCDLIETTTKQQPQGCAPLARICLGTKAQAND